MHSDIGLMSPTDRRFQTSDMKFFQNGKIESIPFEHVYQLRNTQRRVGSDLQKSRYSSGCINQQLLNLFGRRRVLVWTCSDFKISLLQFYGYIFQSQVYNELAQAKYSDNIHTFIVSWQYTFSERTTIGL